MDEVRLSAPFRLIRRDCVDSTNDEARRLVETGAALDLTAIVADRQTGGRGRRGRPWSSPAGNLHLSILIEIGSLHHAAELGFAAATAMVQAVGPLLPDMAVRAKWPNDVVVDGRKLCGMLLESAGPGWLVLGLGVNVVAAPPPAGLNHPACCLADLGCAAGTEAVLGAFGAAFLPLLVAWRAQGFAALRRPWLAVARGVGQPVVVRLERDTLTGMFAGLDEDGALLLDQGPDGMRRILAGDVFFPDPDCR